MKTAKVLFERIIAIFMIISMIMTHFSVFGKTLISYAIDSGNVNNDNIELYAYFVGENGEKISEKECQIDKTLMLKIDVKVKNEQGYGGYSDVEIKIDNSNFKLKDDKKMQIRVNSGETKTIEREIEFAYTEDISKEYLSKESSITLEGKYKNSKGEYTIKGTTNVKVTWLSKEELTSNVNLEVLTNKVYEQIDKRIVQLLITNNTNSISYPIKNTKIELNLPKAAQEIRIHKRTTEGTNGNKDFNNNNYNIDEENKITIDINNTENEVWKKDALDQLVITYELDKEEEYNSTINLASNIVLQDDKKLTQNSEIKIEEEKDGSVTGDIIEKETEIYKGKIYSGEAREYTSINKINIDYIEPLEKIEIDELKPTYIASKETIDANIKYINSEINKEEFIKVFGENGYITVKDQEGNIIANINKDSKTNEQGNIVISYVDMDSIKFVTSKPNNVGTLNIITKKSIIDEANINEENILDLEDKKKLTSIKDEIKVNENIAQKTIELKETKTDLEFNVDKTILRNSEINEEVLIEIKLLANEESQDLYKNPSFKIVFPKQVKELSSKYRMIYGNGLTIKNGLITKEDGKIVLKFSLSGEQKKYPIDQLKQTTIMTYANIKIDENAENAVENISLEYTNEKAISIENSGKKECKISISADKENKPVEPDKSLEPGTIMIETSLTATVGENTLKNKDVVRSGEVIKYKTTIKNTGNTDLEGIKVTGQVPEGTENITVNKKIISYGVGENEEVLEFDDQGNQYFIDDLDYYNKTDNQTVTNTLDIKANETKTFEYEVKVKNNIDTEKVVTNTIKVEKESEKIEKVETISHTLKKGDIELTLIPVLRESAEAKILPGYVYEYDLRVKNNSNQEKRNIVINMENQNLLDILSADIILGDTYASFDNPKSIIIDKLPAGKTAKIIILARINNENSNINLVTFSSSAQESNIVYRSNKLIENVNTLELNMSLTGSNKSEYLLPGQEVTYEINTKNLGSKDIENLVISDNVSDKLEIVRVNVDGKDLSKGEYRIEDWSEYNGYIVIRVDKNLKAGETTNMKVIAKLPNDFKTSKDIEILNQATIDQEVEILQSKKIIYTVKSNATEEEAREQENERNNENSSANILSGVTWLDENKDGIRDEDERLLSNIEVWLIRANTNEIIKRTTTGDNGEYEFNNIPTGKYILIFKYDTDNYLITQYQVDESSLNRNSDVMPREIITNGEKIEVGATDELIVDENIENIDMGLIPAGVFNLELEKTITKVTVKNSQGTSSYDYSDEDLAKIEIGSKTLKGSIVLVEYKLKVKNTGTVPGYAKNIVDYYPNTFRFSEDINNGWYIKGNYLYNETLANELIRPGEEKEVTLSLSIVMTNGNTGLVNNIAEIEEAEDVNGKIIKSDSEIDIQQIDNSNMGSADLIIGIKTGGLVNYVITSLTTMILIALVTYIIYKRILKKRGYHIW